MAGAPSIESLVWNFQRMSSWSGSFELLTPFCRALPRNTGQSSAAVAKLNPAIKSTIPAMQRMVDLPEIQGRQSSFYMQTLARRFRFGQRSGAVDTKIVRGTIKFGHFFPSFRGF